MDTDDPFIGEVKLFHADNHRKRELATGVNQVIQYAQDWAETTGYLVTINLSGRQLELPTDGPQGTWSPYSPRALPPFGIGHRANLSAAGSVITSSG